MNDYDQVKKLIDSGYSVLRKPVTNPKQKEKSIIYLGNKATNHRINLTTSNKEAILLAIERYNYQREIIGFFVTANCVCLGGSSSNLRIFHLDKLIPSLDGFWGWKFKLDKEVGRFSVKIEIKSANRCDAEIEIDKLQRLLDFISIHQEIGLHIQHMSISPVYRDDFTVCWGQIEKMLEPISFSEKEIDQFLGAPDKILKSARGLNQSYIENCAPSRLGMLWSAFENIFDSKPTKLLSSDEIKELIKAAEAIPSLNNDQDRLEKLKLALKTNQFSLKTRNERISENVASIMKISFDDAYQKVHDVSKNRGKHLHSLKDNWNELENSEKFLQEALEKYAFTHISLIS
ncbi:MAG: hypothetical protein IBV52_05675 [Candidatus Bathyarchaeota archaeon]